MSAETLPRLVSLETEELVLGGVLSVGGEAVDELRATGLGPQHLHSEPHRLVLRACLALDEEGQGVDAPSVLAWLRARDLAERAGGSPRLAELLAQPFEALSNFRQHCHRLRSLARVRQVQTLARAIAAEAGGDLDAEAFAASLEQRIGDVLDADSLTPVLSLSDVAKSVLVELEAERRGLARAGLPVVWRDLRSAIGAWVPGELDLIAGRPGMGKSAAGWQVAEYVAAQGHGALFVSAEMPAQQLVRRAVLRRSGVLTAVPRQNSEEVSRVTQAAAGLARLPLEVTFLPGATVATIRAEVRRSAKRLKRDKGAKLGMVVVDYLQLLRSSSSRHSDVERISEISRDLKILAGELNVSVVALSQLNRELEKRADKRPSLADLRGSGSLEQDAARVVFLYRDAIYNKGSNDSTAEAIVAKNRFGGLGTAYLDWCGELTEFSEKKDGFEPDFEGGL